MIKYIPIRGSISSSVKEELTFQTTEEMLGFLFERFARAYKYVGSRSLDKSEITFGNDNGSDNLVGWVNVRNVYIRNICIGYCGE